MSIIIFSDIAVILLLIGGIITASLVILLVNGNLSGLVSRKLLLVFILLVAFPDSARVGRVISRSRLAFVKLTIAGIIQVVVHDNLIRTFISSFRC